MESDLYKSAAAARESLIAFAVMWIRANCTEEERARIQEEERARKEKLERQIAAQEQVEAERELEATRKTFRERNVSDIILFALLCQA